MASKLNHQTKHQLTPAQTTYVPLTVTGMSIKAHVYLPHATVHSLLFAFEGILLI